MASPTVHVRVISLPEAEARRAKMRRRLAALGLDFAFVEGVDGRGFDVAAHPAYDAPRRRRAFGRDMTGGELGCLLSHRSVYEAMVAEDLDPVLVLEDDAVLGADFPAVLASILRLPRPFDLVRFIGYPKIAHLRQRRLCDLDRGYRLVRLATTPGGAYAYLIRRSGAEKLLPALQRNWLPVDVTMGRSWAHGLDWAVVQPAVTDYDRALDSHIGEERFHKPAVNGIGATGYLLGRARHTLTESLNKRLAYWSAWPADRRRLKEVGRPALILPDASS